MKAIVCDQFGDPSVVAVVREVPEAPDPRPGEVRIRVEYASVSHSTDLLIRGKYQSKPPLPFTPGTELVGVVQSCGEGVAHIKPGDRVLALARWGCFAEQVTLPTMTVYPVIAELDSLEALPLPISYGTAYTAFFWKAQLKPSDTVLILGAGSGVGLAAVELAASSGAKVIACASTDVKRDIARACGAQFVIAPNDDFVEQVRQVSPNGVELVFDPVGGSLMERAFKTLAQSGQILSIGFASGKVPTLPLNIMLVKNLSLHGFFYGKYIGWTPSNEASRYQAPMRDMINTLQRLALENKIHPNVTRTYPMENLVQAIDDLHAGRVTGKVALTIGQA